MSAPVHSALKHLRYPREERTLRIDAVCINQASDTEHSFQLATRKRIYPRNWRTLMWLREDTLGATLTAVYLTMPRLLQLTTTRIATEERAAYLENTSKAHTSLKMNTAAWVMFTVYLKSLGDLSRRRYYERLWITQEAVLAPQIVFCVQ
ncbi:uncharacterized protein BCR38DRAFT_145020 [Pseudomassariella vexata]|uniref:Heterokaryon incompatibility domain-containing protein n=1 Tax=Pseudomassariella vexata TaxID=1141098 RepID=A0A1Y2D6N0_9PEZI|nr:uncharacterized protein BCR38DRAFT_145020 [Pseudomassariella vexata]ORY54943.1 hypothetical protein BCR38DRAFT_145020 [Pseudomassariella vexata]